jgi:very-short-patch-repair endonuclease
MSLIPSFRRRGGCAINKMARSHLRGADGVVSHRPPNCHRLCMNEDHLRGTFNRKRLERRRKELRKHGTAAEAVLWKCLQRRQILGKKFRRQESIGPYIVDFYCPECRLVVELDGAPHYGVAGVEEYEAERTAFLQRYGIKIIRFENRVLYDNLDAVLENIRQAVSERSGG